MTRPPLRVGLIGYGSIGRSVATMARDHHDALTIVGAIVRDPGRPRDGEIPPLVRSASELLSLGPEVVAEVAGHDGLREHGPGVLRHGLALVIVAVGAMADPAIERLLSDAALEGGGTLRIASGAIGALDAIAAAKLGGLSRVTHITRKPPATLLPPEQAAALAEPLEMFRGPAREGALRFPESINVAAAVSFAGLGLDRTEVVVLADPAVDRNRHVVEAEGEFGRLRFEIANVPSQSNQRTGRLTAMSVLHELLKMRSRFSVG